MPLIALISTLLEFALHCVRATPLGTDDDKLVRVFKADRFKRKSIICCNSASIILTSTHYIATYKSRLATLMEIDSKIRNAILIYLRQSLTKAKSLYNKDKEQLSENTPASSDARFNNLLTT